MKVNKICRSNTNETKERKESKKVNKIIRTKSKENTESKDNKKGNNNKKYRT